MCGTRELCATLFFCIIVPAVVELLLKPGFVRAGGISKGPCCWETYAGASTDACYGIPRFRMAAQASDLEEALHKEDGVFQLQHIQTKYLQLRGRAVAAGDGQATCSQFQAASQTARRHELFSGTAC